MRFTATEVAAVNSTICNILRDGQVNAFCSPIRNPQPRHSIAETTCFHLSAYHNGYNRWCVNLRDFHRTPNVRLPGIEKIYQRQVTKLGLSNCECHPITVCLFHKLINKPPALIGEVCVFFDSPLTYLTVVASSRPLKTLGEGHPNRARTLLPDEM